MNTRIRTLALAAFLPIALAQVASAQAPTPGDRWRTTMSMEAMGMKMPGMTNEVCSPRDKENAPPVGNDQCTATNQRREGKTLKFDMQCKDGMTGTMEMTQESPTKWNGKMTANTKEGQMSMVMRSEKLPGECDASEMERKMNRMVAEGNAQQAKACLESGRGLSFQMFTGPQAACKDKASIDAYCGQAKTMKGYNTLARKQRMGARVYKGAEGKMYQTVLADTGKLCGFSPETVRTQYCGTAQSKKEWTFFAEECPELSKPLALRECVGRDFTTPVSPPYVDFCSAYASAGRSSGGSSRSASEAEEERLSSGDASTRGANSGSQGTGDGQAGNGESGEQADKPKPTDKAKEALERSKNALRGLFGR